MGEERRRGHNDPDQLAGETAQQIRQTDVDAIRVYHKGTLNACSGSERCADM